MLWDLLNLRAGGMGPKTERAGLITLYQTLHKATRTTSFQRKLIATSHWHQYRAAVRCWLVSTALVIDSPACIQFLLLLLDERAALQ
jgi:hypothetical protein